MNVQTIALVLCGFFVVGVCRSQEKAPDTRDEFENWSGSDAEPGMLGFVQEFSSLVFKFGGVLIHGASINATVRF